MDELRAVGAALPDRRTGKNLSYTMADFALSAFAVFFTQSPSFLATLNLLAFLFHTVLGFSDEHYRLVRAALPSRQTFFQHVSALTHHLHFPSWAGLLRFRLRGLQLGPYAKGP